MRDLVFSPQDVAETRFASSALGEAILSFRALRDGTHGWPHGTWVRKARAWVNESGVRFPLLSGLVRPGGRVPDFVMPPPETSTSRIEHQIGRVCATPAEHVRRDLAAMRQPLPASLSKMYADPGAGLRHLADELDAYWDGVIAAYWPRIANVLDADVLHRARHIAEGGTTRLFQDLHPDVKWQSDTLSVTHRSCRDIRTARGRGLLLVPSVFGWPKVFTQTADPWQPTLIYPARGVATVWEHDDSTTPSALAKVLGVSRARLLHELDEPATTVDLARRIGMTSGGVSQHLTALRDAGLVTACRDRRFVFYARTSVANELCTHGDGRPFAHPDVTPLRPNGAPRIVRHFGD